MRSYYYFRQMFFTFFLIGVNLPVLIAQQKNTYSAEDTLNVVLLIDRSGSMGGDNKIENARIAAKAFTSFLRVGDAISIVSFNDTAHTEFSFQTIESDTTKLTAQVTIDSIKADGSTSIGDGIRVGQVELNKGNPDYYQAMLLLSDGKENMPPYVADVLPTIPEKTDIYVIGLGWNVDGALLNHVATETSGAYLFVQAAEELQLVFTLLRGFMTGQQTLSNFTDTILEGEIHTHDVTVDALTSSASFFVTFGHGDVDLELVTPGGDIIDPQAAQLDSNIDYTEGATYDFYTIQSPQAGQWSLRVLGVDLPYPAFYSATAQVSSGLEMVSCLDRYAYKAGEPIFVMANLNENGQPILHASVSTTVASSMCSLVTLFDDGLHNDANPGDGVYGNYFTHTLQPGNYTFTTNARGIGTQGGAFTREYRLSTYVTPSTAPAVVAAFPDSGRQGDSLPVILEGGNFTDGALISFSGIGISVASISQIRANEIIAIISIAPDAATGFHGLTVTNPDGQQGFTPGLFFVIAMPTQFELMQNYPNPFNMTTIINYNLPHASWVNLKIYNMLGQRIRTLVDAEQGAGFKSVSWDGRDEGGNTMASGVYFYQLTTPDVKMIKKLLVLR